MGSRRTSDHSLTLIQQWIGATVIAILPLVAAVCYTVWALDQQTRAQSVLVQTMADLNRLGLSLADRLKELERSARQFQLLGRASFYQIYRQKNEQLDETLQELEALLPANVDREALHNIGDMADAIERRLPAAHGSDSALHYLESHFTSAHALVARIDTRINQRLRDSIKNSQQQFHEILVRAVVISGFALPNTLILLVIASVMVSRPIRRLSEAVHRLGQRHWNVPVAISGPADLVALGQQLEWTRQDLLTADAQKQAFVRNITHELKSPLAAIIDAGSLLADEVPGKLGAEQHDVLQILLASADNLQNMIQQLLNYNAASFGLHNEPQTIELSQLCRQVCARLQGADSSRSPCWQCPDEPLEVVGDRHCLEMIFANLLSNARDFSPPGSTVTVNHNSDGETWSVEVTDRGPGIPADELAHVFEPFYQGSNRRHGPLQGSGVGLAIVDECVRRLGGRIDVDSRPGDGTRFHITVPHNNRMST